MSVVLERALSESFRRSERLKGRAQPAAGDTGVAGVFASRYGGWLGGGGAAASQSLATHAEQYRHFCGWPYAAIRAIAQRGAGQPFRVARMMKSGASKNRPNKASVPASFKAFSDDLEILSGHPLLDAVADPNPIMVRSALIYVTLASLELTGKAYWWFRPSEDGERTIEIWPVPSSWLEAAHSERRLMDHWLLRPGGSGTPVRLERDHVAYFYYPDPSDPLNAVSPLSANARAVVADEHIAESQRRAFTNGIFPGHAVIVGRHPDIQGRPGERPFLNKENRDRIIHAITQQYQGVMRADQPIILDGLIENIIPITKGNREMDWRDSGRYTKERITQGYGTNPIVLGQVEGANRSSSATADKHFVSTTVNPKLDLISQCLTAWAGPIFDDGRGRLVAYLEPAKAEDVELQIMEENVLITGRAITKNELRGRHGMSPLSAEEGGDEFAGTMPYSKPQQTAAVSE